MTKNFTFCNYDFLDLFCYKPGPFYNQFLLEKETRRVIDSIGNHPDFHIVFRYNAKKKIRATFIIFDDNLEEMDVACICTLFHGDRRDSYCFFYEVYEDSSIGCVQVAHGNETNRIVKELNVGDDIDTYFEKLCASFGNPAYKSIAMLYWKESDNCFRLLDMILSELPNRCVPLLGGDPEEENKTLNGTDYLFYKSKIDNSYLVARTKDGHNPIDIMIEDILQLNLKQSN